MALGWAYPFPPLSSGGAFMSSAILPFPHPPHRTGQADFLHPALRTRPSRLRPRHVVPKPGQTFPARSTRRGARVDSSHPA